MYADGGAAEVCSNLNLGRADNRASSIALYMVQYAMRTKICDAVHNQSQAPG